MSSRDADDFLAESQEVIDDYVTWHESADSASWAADGSHEPDQISGDYYADDGFNDSWGQPYGGGTGPAYGLFQVLSPTFQRYAEGRSDDTETVTAWGNPDPIQVGVRSERDRYIPRLRYVEYAADLQNRPSRVRAWWQYSAFRVYHQISVTDEVFDVPRYQSALRRLIERADRASRDSFRWLMDRPRTVRPSPPPPVDVTIREDTLRELVPYDVARHADQPLPKPFASPRAGQPTGRAAQRSTYERTLPR